MFGVFMQL